MSSPGPLGRSVAVLLLLVVVSGPLVVAGVPARPVDASSATVEESVGTQTGSETPFSVTEFAVVEGFDDVRTHIEVTANRSATWRVQYRYRLDDESAERAFDRARDNVTDLPGVFIELMRDASRRAERQTGREMDVQNGNVSAFRSAPHGRFGIVEYQFTWTGFAGEGDGGRLVVGDAINGYQVGENESLIVSWRDDLQMADVSPRPDTTANSSVRWNGPREFTVENPTVVLRTTGAESNASTLPLIAVGGTVAVLSVAVLAYGIGTGRLAGLFPARTSDTADETRTELLSDEERVLHLLEENSGRMKQQEVKEELDWSRTKTSNVVNELQEADKIEVYRLGRENTLALPGEMDV